MGKINNEVFDTGFEHGKGIKTLTNNTGKPKLTGFKKLEELNPEFIQCNDTIVINGKEYIVLTTVTDFANGKFQMWIETK